MHWFYCSQIRVRLLSEPIEETGIPQGRVGRHLYSERTLWTLRVSRPISSVSYETPAVRAPADLEEKLAWQCFLNLKKNKKKHRGLQHVGGWWWFHLIKACIWSAWSQEEKRRLHTQTAKWRLHFTQCHVSWEAEISGQCFRCVRSFSSIVKSWKPSLVR